MTVADEFEALLVGSRRRLLSYAYGLCRCRDAAEDLVSETMARALRYRDGFRPGTNFEAWTTFMLRNVFLSQRRRARWDGGSVEDLPPSSLPSMTAPQGFAIDLIDALRALAELPLDQRIAIEIVGSGASYEEAAEDMVCSVGTVKSRLARGRDGLRELLA